MVLTATTASAAPAVHMAWIGEPDDSHHGILSVSLSAVEEAAAQTANAAPRPATLLNVILDNSMSMGEHARAGVQTLALPLVQSGLFDAGVIALFDDATRCYPAESAADVSKLLSEMPRQGMTDILGGVTFGMRAAANRITSAIRGKKANFAPGAPIRLVTVMLTDGCHNKGPRPDRQNLAAAHAAFMKQLRNAGDGDVGEIQHMVVMFCLTASSDATVSMEVKAAFENTEVPGLPNVFFAATHAEMTAALAQVIDGLKATVGAAGSRFVTVNLVGARVMTTDEAKSTILLRPGAAPVEMLVEVTDRDAFGVKIDTEETAPATHAVAGVTEGLDAVRGAIGPLARASVAGGSEAKLAARIDAIARVIDVCEKLQARARAATAASRRHRDPNAVTASAAGSDDDQLARLSPAERRQLAREIRTATVDFQTVRNELFDLKVKGRSNSDKLALLTGRQQKFASVAAARSKADGRTAAEVYADTASVRQRVADFIREDLAALRARGVDPDSLPVSAVSLLSQRECLEQWVEDVEIVRDARDHDDDAIFDVLCAFGILAAPIRYANGECVQVDPMQLRVAALGVETVDTASMMLTFRLGRSLKLADGHSYVDALPLIDPAFPRATSFLIRRAMWGEHLTSATISRDLYLYLPQMQLAAHTHAFRKAITDGLFFDDAARGTGLVGVSQAHVRLALRVLYSASRLVRPKRSTEAERDHLRRWLAELGTLTRAEGDKVDHPALLQLLLALFAWDRTPGAAEVAEEGVPAWSDVDERSALLNLLNEVLARRVASNAAADGIGVGQRLLGVTAANSPAAQADPFVEEPSVESIQARCAKAAPASFDPASDKARDTIAALFFGDAAKAATVDATAGNADVSCASVAAAVESVWAPYVAVHRFITALLAAQRARGLSCSMAAVFESFEVAGGVPDATVTAVAAELKAAYAQEASVWDTLCVANTTAARNQAALCALLQATLYSTSRVRFDLQVVAKDVTDPATLRELIAALHMAHYNVSLHAKQQQFAALVGDVIAAQSRMCDTASLRTMIGVHTHGHCKQKFWGFLEGVLMDPDAARQAEKLAAIRETSCHDVAKAISRATSAIARKRRNA